MRFIHRHATAAAIAASLLPATPAQSQPVGASQPEPGSAIAAIVRVPKPWYAPRALVVSRMRETVAQYEALPGLAHKAFTLAQDDGRYGGIYLWQDAASARAFFGPAWFARVEKERGVKGDVRFYEVPVAVDNGGPAPQSSDQAVATLVTVPTPPGVGKAQLIQEFRAAVPSYRQVPGLLRKYFIITDEGGFGGIYLWRDEASAQAWFSPAWHDRVRTRYGAPATLAWFDAPILLPSKLPDNTPRLPGL